MKRIARWVTWAAIIATVAFFFGNALDNALKQEAYKTCKQLPEQIQKTKNCEEWKK